MKDLNKVWALVVNSKQVTRFTHIALSTMNSLILAISMSLSQTLRTRRAPFTRKFLTLKETREGQCALLAWATCQVIFIQSNLYAIVGYFGVTCPEPQHNLASCNMPNRHKIDNCQTKMNKTKFLLLPLQYLISLY